MKSRPLDPQHDVGAVEMTGMKQLCCVIAACCFAAMAVLFVPQTLESRFSANLSLVDEVLVTKVSSLRAALNVQGSWVERFLKTANVSRLQKYKHIRRRREVGDEVGLFARCGS